MFIPRPFPPSEVGDHILAVVTFAPRDLLHLKRRPMSEDTFSRLLQHAGTTVSIFVQPSGSGAWIIPRILLRILEECL